MIPGLCPFDDIFLFGCCCVAGLWLRNKYRKYKGLPPITRCKHGSKRG